MLTRLASSAAFIRRTLLDLLFPPRCVVCRRAGEWFCPACRAQIQLIPPPWCERCGRPLKQAECRFCRETPLNLDGLRAAAFFEGGLRDAIHSLKYRNRPELAVPLGAVLNEYLRLHPLPIDAIIPVPLYAERERLRGYNQSALLAHEIAMYQNLPMWYNGVERIRSTRPQIELDARARRENVRDAFRTTANVAGAQILMIDDVCTTGATMDACSIALKQCGAKSVWGLALARGR